MKKISALILGACMVPALFICQAEAAVSAEEFFELCRSGTPRQVEAALKAGADVGAKNAGGRTPLMFAAGNNSPEVFNVLIRAGADVNAKDNYGGTPLTSAAWQNNNPEVLNILVKAGADVHAKNEYGFTALMEAARYGDNPEILQVLIQAGSDVGAKGGAGLTPLMLAVADYVGSGDYTLRKNNREFLALLIQAGADVNAKDDRGRTALSFAVEENPEENLLVEANRSGVEISLNMLGEKRKPQIVSLLLASGAAVSENDVRLAQGNEYLRGTAVLEELRKNLKK